MDGRKSKSSRTLRSGRRRRLCLLCAFDVIEIAHVSTRWIVECVLARDDPDRGVLRTLVTGGEQWTSTTHQYPQVSITGPAPSKVLPCLQAATLKRLAAVQNCCGLFGLCQSCLWIKTCKRESSVERKINNGAPLTEHGALQDPLV